VLTDTDDQIFRYDYLLWHYQEAIFREIQKASLAAAQVGGRNGNMTFQLALCHMLGFGTLAQPEKAVEMIEEARQLGHPVAAIFGEQLCSGVAGQPAETYTSCVIAGLREGMMGSPPGSQLLRALFRADVAAAHRVIDAGVDAGAATTADCCSPLHMLFVFGGEAWAAGERMLAQRNPYLLSKDSVNREAYNSLLDLPCTAVHRLHAQWPLELTGTPLAFAIATASEPAVRALLALGADPCTNIYSFAVGDKRSYWTALHLAVSLHAPTLLRLLLNAMRAGGRNTSGLALFPLGCALPFASKLERYAMYGTQLANQRLLETVELITLAGAAGTSLAGMTPLMQAIDFADVDVVTALVTRYPEIVQWVFRDPENTREWILPVHFAAQLAGRSKDFDGAMEILALLVGLDVQGAHSTDNLGRTPLHFAAAGNSPVAAEWLVGSGGADINVRDKRGRRPLHFVSTVSTAGFLIAAGAVLDACDDYDWTVLHHVCERGSIDVVNYLIERGALLTADAHRGVLNASILGRSNEIVYALLLHGVSVRDSTSSPPPLYVAATVARLDIVQTLLDAGADATARGECGRTTLHAAAEVGNVRTLRLLLAAGPSESEAVHEWVNARDDFGQTALHLAAGTADVTIAELLLGHGADQVLQDMWGRTPLHVAAKADASGVVGGVDGQSDVFDKLAFCQLLVEERCDALTMRDGNQRLPWQATWSPLPAKRDFELLELFFAARFDRAVQQFASSTGYPTVADVLTAAIRHGDAQGLVTSLVAQRDGFGTHITGMLLSQAVSLLPERADTPRVAAELDSDAEPMWRRDQDVWVAPWSLPFLPQQVIRFDGLHSLDVPNDSLVAVPANRWWSSVDEMRQHSLDGGVPMLPQPQPEAVRRRESLKPLSWVKERSPGRLRLLVKKWVPGRLEAIPEPAGPEADTVETAELAANFAVELSADPPSPRIRGQDEGERGVDHAAMDLSVVSAIVRHLGAIEEDRKACELLVADSDSASPPSTPPGAPKAAAEEEEEVEDESGTEVFELSAAPPSPPPPQLRDADEERVAARRDLLVALAAIRHFDIIEENQKAREYLPSPPQFGSGAEPEATAEEAAERIVGAMSAYSWRTDERVWGATRERLEKLEAYHQELRDFVIAGAEEGASTRTIIDRGEAEADAVYELSAEPPSPRMGANGCLRASGPMAR